MIRVSVLKRELLKYMLRKTDPDILVRKSEKKVVRAFRKAARDIPYYRELLAANDLAPSDITTLPRFRLACPPQDKRTTFLANPANNLTRPGGLADLAAVLTSSGHGHSFGFGVMSRRQQEIGIGEVDLGLSYHFDADRRKTLLVNCLPMGVKFESRLATIADVSTRDDMALAIAEYFSPYFDQIIYVGDPLFLKKLADSARFSHLDWHNIQVHFIIGEETFGENFRSYLADCFCIDLKRPETGSIRSSFGVGELGLNLLFETLETVELRRRSISDIDLAQRLFEHSSQGVPPLLFSYNPLRTFVEVLDADEHGIGQLAVSMLNGDTLQMFRYRTGDRIRFIPRDALRDIELDDGRDLREAVRLPLVAFYGRESEQIDDRRNILDFKDALYRDPNLAADLTGAIKIKRKPSGWSMDVQLSPGSQLATASHTKLSSTLCPFDQPNTELTLWRYEEFPYSMSLDYERKFRYLGT